LKINTKHSDRLPSEIWKTNNVYELHARPTNAIELRRSRLP
jgi:hypothetical protein